MRTILMTATVLAFAAPALADDEQVAEEQRLDNLEHMTITALKDEPAASERLTELETVISTAPKEQPAEHKTDNRTAELLSELEKE